MLGDVVHYRESDGSESLAFVVNNEDEGQRLVVFSIDDVIEENVRKTRGENVSQRVVICAQGYADENTWHLPAACRG